MEEGISIEEVEKKDEREVESETDREEEDTVEERLREGENRKGTNMSV